MFGQRKIYEINCRYFINGLKRYEVDDNKDIQSLWVTSWCSSDFQRSNNQIPSSAWPQKYQISSGSQSSHRLIATPTEEMEDMFLQCNKNAIYVLNTSYRYGELDMINLFGSPAGRAINEITSTKTCNNSEISSKTSAKKHLQQQQHKHHSSQHSCNSQQTANSIDNLSLHQQHNEIRYNYCRNDSSIEKTTRNLIFKSNVIAKKAKFWKFLEEDKWDKNSIEDLSTSSSGKSSLSIWRKQSKKSSSELYREAAQILGLSCTLSDSCRCLDCQSRYFDCDDSDTCSEQSYSGDYEDHLIQLKAIDNGTEQKSDETLSPTDKIGDDTSLSYCESLSDLSTDDGSERDKKLIPPRKILSKIKRMAPFKLKFRMGGSRSTSQETETEPPALLLSNSVVASLGASNTTIDSEYNSLGSIISSDQRTLLPNHNVVGDNATGYTNPTLTQNSTETSNTIPQSPPPSYEHVLEENRLANLDKDNNPASCTTSNIAGAVDGGGVSYMNNHPLTDCSSKINSNENSSASTKREGDIIESPVYSFSTMTSPSHENLLLGNVGSCDPLFGVQCDEQIDLDERVETNGSVNDEEEDRCSMASDINNESEEEWDSHDNQYQELHSPDTIINNKSTKEIYKAVAKQWGITCKMSEQCRCMECQSNYFDCEFDDNEHHKTDGGLGAGTPMFISEVMHGSACVIL